MKSNDMLTPITTACQAKVLTSLSAPLPNALEMAEVTPPPIAPAAIKTINV